MRVGPNSQREGLKYIESRYCDCYTSKLTVGILCPLNNLSHFGGIQWHLILLSILISSDVIEVEHSFICQLSTCSFFSQMDPFIRTCREINRGEKSRA